MGGAEEGACAACEDAGGHAQEGWKDECARCGRPAAVELCAVEGACRGCGMGVFLRWKGKGNLVLWCVVLLFLHACF